GPSAPGELALSSMNAIIPTESPTDACELRKLGGTYDVFAVARGARSRPPVRLRRVQYGGERAGDDDLGAGGASPRAHWRYAARRRHEIRFPTARPARDGRRRRGAAGARPRRLGRVQANVRRRGNGH